MDHYRLNEWEEAYIVSQARWDLYRCGCTAEDCGINTAEEGADMDLRPHLDAIIAKSVIQESGKKWTYIASELAFIANRHAGKWGLTRRYSPSSIGKYMKRLFEDETQVRDTERGVVYLDHVNIELEICREPKKSKDGGTQLQRYYNFYTPWPEDGSSGCGSRGSDRLSF